MISMNRFSRVTSQVLGARFASAGTSGARFSLPPLPYSMDALEPHISKETLEYHYGKHHKAYVDNLNKIAESNSDVAKQSLDQLLKNAPKGPIFNNAAQIWNHTFYWKSLSPNGGGRPNGALAAQIDRDFGSFEAFKDKFSAAAAGHFGSGWAWLVKTDDGKLKIVDTHDAGNPLRDGTGKPLLTIDVWEHSYYISYRNARPKYIEAFWNVVNWEFANANYTS
jgi:Fe-Mn family superoxide dismutase